MDTDNLVTLNVLYVLIVERIKNRVPRKYPWSTGEINCEKEMPHTWGLVLVIKGTVDTVTTCATYASLVTLETRSLFMIRVGPKKKL